MGRLYKGKKKPSNNPFKSASEVLAKTPSVVLTDPKFPHNVGAAIRACSCFDVEQLWITGTRLARQVANMSRIPREERMKGYANVEMVLDDRPFDRFPEGTVPVAIELSPGAENLYSFEHPESAVYVFGPEDGSIPQSYRRLCHRRVFIPTRHCVNLAAAIYLTLNDRKMKRVAAGLESVETIDDALNEERGWGEDQAVF